MSNPYNLPDRVWSLINDVADRHAYDGMTVEKIFSNRRTRDIAHARQECFYEIYQLRRSDGERAFSLNRIAAFFKAPWRPNGLDHTTVLFGIRKHAARLGLENDGAVHLDQSENAVA